MGVTMQNQSKEIVAKSVFISYSTDDSASAEQMRDGLEAGDGDVAGIPCWMAPRDIAPGLEYGSQIVAAIEECSVLVLLLSESSNRSRFVLNEVERAVSKNKIVIPVRIHNVTPSRSLEFFISNAQWIDAWQGALAAPLESLTAAIRTHLTPVTLSPSHPVTPPSPLRHNLPTPATPFIGRATELAAVAALLADPTVRLTTIVASGGMGKTRLALETGRRQLSQSERFADGVFFVPLAALAAPEHIVPAVAEGLGFQLKTGQQTRSPEQQVCDYLEAKALLLILDNYEHLLEGAGLVARLLQAAPRLHVLVTSRERLHLQGEQIYPIQGLEFRQTIPEELSETPDDAARYTAVQLFAQSARRVQADFELRPAELNSLTRICRLVGGVPLALELAAGWVEMLPLAEIAEEIQRSLDFLETENRDVPERQRSMRAVFDYSWQRLSQPEQAALAQLSVFRGGCDRSAAEQVAGASLRILAALVAKSLVQVSADRVRYSIHELIRQYSAQALALLPETEGAARDRHSVYYAEKLRSLAAELMGGGQMAALTEIETEHENLRAAWDWAIQAGLLENTERAMESLCLFYEMRGRYQEGREACEVCVEQKALQAEPAVYVRSLIWLATFVQVLGQPTEVHEYLQQSLVLIESGALTSQEADRSRAVMLMVLGSLAYVEGQGQKALEFYEQSLALFTALNDPWHIAKVGLRLSRAMSVFNLSGDVRVWHKQLMEAREVAQRSLGIYRDLHDRAGIAESVSALGWIMHRSGAEDEALSLLQEALAIYEESGIHRGHSNTHVSLCVVYSALGDYAELRRHAEVAIRLDRELGDLEQLGRALYQLGKAAIIDRAWDEADQVLQESGTISRRSGRQDSLSLGLGFWAYADFSQGRSVEMRQHLREALQIGYESRLHNAYIVSLPLVALLLAERGEIERALELYAQAFAYLVSGFKYRWFEDMAGQQIAAAAAHLPPEVVAAAQERGRQRNLWERAEELLAEIEGWV